MHIGKTKQVETQLHNNTIIATKMSSNIHITSIMPLMLRSAEYKTHKEDLQALSKVYFVNKFCEEKSRQPTSFIMLATELKSLLLIELGGLKCARKYYLKNTESICEDMKHRYQLMTKMSGLHPFKPSNIMWPY